MTEKDPNQVQPVEMKFLRSGHSLLNKNEDTWEEIQICNLNDKTPTYRKNGSISNTKTSEENQLLDQERDGGNKFWDRTSLNLIIDH